MRVLDTHGTEHVVTVRNEQRLEVKDDPWLARDSVFARVGTLAKDDKDGHC